MLCATSCPILDAVHIFHPSSRYCAQLPVHSARVHGPLCKGSFKPSCFEFPVHSARVVHSASTFNFPVRHLQLPCPLCKARAICSWLQLSPLGFHLLVQLSPVGSHLLALTSWLHRSPVGQGQGSCWSRELLGLHRMESRRCCVHFILLSSFHRALCPRC